MPRCVIRIFGCGVRGVSPFGSRVGRVRSRVWLGVCECGWVCARKRGEEPLLVWFLSPFFFFVWSGRRGLNSLPSPWEGDALPSVSYVRSVFPGCSLVACLRWGVERMTGLEPASSTLARWRSDLLSCIRVCANPCLPLWLAYLGARGWALIC